jgi:enoyl-CoA hydratase/carnithine racemase
LNPESILRAVLIRTREEGPVLVVTMDRPGSLNAIDPESHAELLEAWNRLRDSEALRVGVLTGAGNKAFCAGVDLKRLSEFYSESVPGERRRRWARSPGLGGLTRNYDPGKPVIAAVNGYCLGLGLELALACDIRIASPNAQFGLPEVRWGIIPGQGGTQRLPRVIPPGVALEMILTGDPISAERAHAIGLVNRIIPLSRLRSEAVKLASRIAAWPPRGVQHAREAVRRGLDLPLPYGLQLEHDLADPLRGNADSRAAIASFGAKRSKERSRRP